jgi:hypothetical protein
MSVVVCIGSKGTSTTVIGDKFYIQPLENIDPAAYRSTLACIDDMCVLTNDDRIQSQFQKTADFFRMCPHIFASPVVISRDHFVVDHLVTKEVAKAILLGKYVVLTPTRVEIHRTFARLPSPNFFP